MIEIIEISHEHQSKSELARNTCVTHVTFFTSPDNFLLTETICDTTMSIVIDALEENQKTQIQTCEDSTDQKRFSLKIILVNIIVINSQKTFQPACVCS